VSTALGAIKRVPREARDRLGLQFELLGDSSREFTNQLRLPTFEIAGERLLNRLILVLSDGRIEHYPVFPPDEHAEEVARWLETHPLD